MEMCEMLKAFPFEDLSTASTSFIEQRLINDTVIDRLKHFDYNALNADQQKELLFLMQSEYKATNGEYYIDPNWDCFECGDECLDYVVMLIDDVISKVCYKCCFFCEEHSSHIPKTKWVDHLSCHFACAEHRQICKCSHMPHHGDNSVLLATERPIAEDDWKHCRKIEEFF